MSPCYARSGPTFNICRSDFPLNKWEGPDAFPGYRAEIMMVTVTVTVGHGRGHGRDRDTVTVTVTVTGSRFIAGTRTSNAGSLSSLGILSSAVQTLL